MTRVVFCDTRPRTENRNNWGMFEADWWQRKRGMLVQAVNAARPHLKLLQQSLFCSALYNPPHTPVHPSVDMVRVLIELRRCFRCAHDSESISCWRWICKWWICICAFFRCVVPRPGDHGGRHPLPRRTQWYNPESVLRRFQYATGATLSVRMNL